MLPATPANEECHCNGTGYYRVDVPLGHPQFGKFILCSCRSAENIEHLQKLCGLSEAERGVSLDDIDLGAAGKGTKEMVEALRGFVQCPKGMITISGGCGNAKTMGLMGTVNALVGAQIEAVYMTAFVVLSYIREAFNDRGQVVEESAYQRLRNFERVRVLALDELDKAAPFTDWEAKQITDLFDWRYRQGLDGTHGTLLALNRTELLPEWIISRMRDGANRWIVNNDPDLRSKLG